MTDTDVLQDLLEPRHNLTTTQVHDLLHSAENHLGGRPQQVIDSPMRFRWLNFPDEMRTGDEMVEITLVPKAVNSELIWDMEGTHYSSLDKLRDEHLDLKYAEDPDAGSDVPYGYNICAGDRDNWEYGFITQLTTWYEIENDLGKIISNVSANLAALPPAWFDGGIGISIQAHNTAITATRDTLVVALPILDHPDGPGIHVFTFSPTAALECGKHVTSSVISMLDPSQTIADLGVSLDSLDPQNMPVSGLMSSAKAAEELGERGEGKLRIAELIDLATEHEIARSEEELQAIFEGD